MSVPASISVFGNLDEKAGVWLSAAVDTCQHAGYIRLSSIETHLQSLPALPLYAWRATSSY